MVLYQNQPKVTLFIGTRPNIPKAWTLIRSIKSLVHLTVVHSGQHYDNYLGDNFIKNFNIDVNINLNIGSCENDYSQVAEIIKKIGDHLSSYKPDYVIVIGDVNTTVGAAIAASRQGIQVIHLEAGLRSGSWDPEEINRKLISSCTDYHLCTSQESVNNLLKEGIKASNIFLVGNTMAETFLLHRKQMLNQQNFLKDVTLDKDEYILFTVHKPYNLKKYNFIYSILDFMLKEKIVIFPIHPHASKTIDFTYLRNKYSNFKIITPLTYLQYGKLIMSSSCVVTDSSGTQEEASIANVKCITIAPGTARPETCTMGTNVIVGSDLAQFYKAFYILVNKSQQIPLWDTVVSKRIQESFKIIILNKNTKVSNSRPESYCYRQLKYN